MADPGAAAAQPTPLTPTNPMRKGVLIHPMARSVIQTADFGPAHSRIPFVGLIFTIELEHIVWNR